MTNDNWNEADRDRIGEQTMDEQPGLGGGEFPGAEDETDSMSDELAPDGEATAFGGHLGEPGPAGTIGTIDPETREQDVLANARSRAGEGE